MKNQETQETKGTEDLKSTLVLDLCQGILETPCFDAAVPPEYETLRTAFEELHDVASTLARHLVVSLSDGLQVSESDSIDDDELMREQHTGEGEPRA